MRGSKNSHTEKPTTPADPPHARTPQHPHPHINICQCMHTMQGHRTRKVEEQGVARLRATHERVHLAQDVVARRHVGALPLVVPQHGDVREAEAAAQQVLDVLDVRAAALELRAGAGVVAANQEGLLAPLCSRTPPSVTRMPHMHTHYHAPQKHAGLILISHDSRCRKCDVRSQKVFARWP